MLKPKSKCILLSELNRKRLTEEQTQKLEFIDLFANQGKFITARYKTDFKFFE